MQIYARSRSQPLPLPAAVRDATARADPPRPDGGGNPVRGDGIRRARAARRRRGRWLDKLGARQGERSTPTEIWACALGEAELDELTEREGEWADRLMRKCTRSAEWAMLAGSEARLAA